MFKIQSIRVFIQYFLITLLVGYIIFKVFHYYYPYNYCDYFSDSVIQNSLDDLKETKACINTLICELGEIKTESFTQETGVIYTEKDFSCIRKVQPGVWK